MRHLLTTKTAKMDKSKKFDHLSAVLHLEPRYRVNGFNTCPQAGKCFATCLAHSGRNRFDVNKAARLWKTKMLLENREDFMALLVKDIEAVVRRAGRLGVIPTIRLNGTSDIAWETVPITNRCITYSYIFGRFPDVQFIDYTKIPERMFAEQPDNYHLTYSVSEKTPPGLVQRIFKETRFNCAVVFANELPKHHAIDGKVYKVIDGDQSDLRHLDKRGCIVGLTYKLAFVKQDGTAFRPKRDNGFLRVLEN